MESNKEDVALRAYQLWQQRGCPHGSPETDWYEAELQVSSGGSTTAAAETRAEEDASVDESVDATFPASDAPSTHTPDNPPSNAGAKWEAVRKPGGRGR